MFDDPFNTSSIGALNEYLEQYQPVSRPYVQEFFQKRNTINNVYVPIYDVSSSKWLMGSNEIEFKGTPGLYEYVFYKEPINYNNEHREEYIKLLELTNVRRKANKHLKAYRLDKYYNNIQPHLTPEAATRTRAATTGSCLAPSSSLTYNNKPFEYIYWDDPYELVERLRLLVSSRHAGNTSHENEIIAMINELEEANIIRN